MNRAEENDLKVVLLLSHGFIVRLVTIKVMIVINGI